MLFGEKEAPDAAKKISHSKIIVYNKSVPKLTQKCSFCSQIKQTPQSPSPLKSRRPRGKPPLFHGENGPKCPNEHKILIGTGELYGILSDFTG
jgi:hypothetical protein